MTLNVLKLDYNSKFLEFIINTKEKVQNELYENKFNIFLSFFKRILENYVLNISTCTLLGQSSKI